MVFAVARLTLAVSKSSAMSMLIFYVMFLGAPLDRAIYAG